MDRRAFVRVAIAVPGLGLLSIGCGAEPEPHERPNGRPGRGKADDPAAGGVGDGGVDDAAVDAAVTDATPDAARPTVTMYDTYAQALYFDGSHGPLTGIVRAEYLLGDVAVTLDFWHGHGGRLHRWTIAPEHYAQLKRGRRVNLETTVVDGHSHRLFVDPVDRRWRVPGAPPVQVPL